MRRRKGRSEADIASRGSSKARKLDGEFLEGTESSLVGVETMASEGFSDAWSEEADPSQEASLDAALDVGQGSDSIGDLDQSPARRVLVGLLLISAIAAGGWWMSQSATKPDEEPVARASSELDPNVIASPVSEREYEPSDGPVIVEQFESLNDWFVQDAESGSMLPRPANALGVGAGELDAATQATTNVGTVVWAGRLHVAFVSDGALLAGNSECAVVAVAAENLSSLDVAGEGACGDEFEATGDRLACMGENSLLIEVWPFNPDSVIEQAPADVIRSRIEYSVGEDLVSQRSSISLDGVGDGRVNSASTLTGEPGDVVDIEIDGLVGTCELVDRDSVDVRLLPG